MEEIIETEALSHNRPLLLPSFTIYDEAGQDLSTRMATFVLMPRENENHAVEPDCGYQSDFDKSYPWESKYEQFKEPIVRIMFVLRLGYEWS